MPPRSSRRVGAGAHLVLEVGLGRLRRHVDAGAGRVELPAVVDAAQAFLFVADRRTARRRGGGRRSGSGRPRRRSSRKAMRFSPSSRMRSGGQSGDGSSSERTAGIQYWRMRSPMGVPGPTRHSSFVVLDAQHGVPPEKRASPGQIKGGGRGLALPGAQPAVSARNKANLDAPSTPTPPLIKKTPPRP